MLRLYIAILVYMVVYPMSPSGVAVVYCKMIYTCDFGIYGALYDLVLVSRLVLR